MLLVGVPLGWLAGAIVAEDDGVAAGVATGLGTGVVTGGIAAIYTAWRDHVWTRWAQTICARYASESILHHGPARLGRSVSVDFALYMVWAWHLLQREGAGWAVLTTERLVFQPRVDSSVVDIPVTEIVGARRGDSLIPNAIALRLRNQRTIELRVHDRREWLEKLETLPHLTVMR